MRLGVLPSTWSELPAPGVLPVAGLDYAPFERTSPIVCREMERPALE
jgi:hypothetical protein